jgi:hypothetical protein
MAITAKVMAIAVPTLRTSVVVPHDIQSRNEQSLETRSKVSDFWSLTCLVPTSVRTDATIAATKSVFPTVIIS